MLDKQDFDIAKLIKRILAADGNKRESRFCFIYALALSISLVVGHSLYEYGDFSGLCGTWIKGLVSLLAVLGLTMAVRTLCIWSVKVLSKQGMRIEKKRWTIFKFIPLVGMLIFLAWLPCYLSYYPGVLSYDMYAQTPEALGIDPIGRHHPPLHTFIWKMCLLLEQRFGGSALVIYSLLQMLVLASAFAYVIQFLAKRKVCNGVVLFALLFFCLNPVIAIFSFIPTKDAMFAGALILFVVELCSFAISEKGMKDLRGMARIILFGTLSCLLRNNMVYALIPSAIMGCIILKKKCKWFIMKSICIVCLFGVVNGPIYSILGVQDGNIKEMLSVPMQQMSYVATIHLDELSKETIEEAYPYFPIDCVQYVYNPRIADPVKSSLNQDAFKDNPKTFFEIWAKMLVRYPSDYVVAFLDLNLPCWYLFANAVDEYSEVAYIETNIYEEWRTGYEVVRESKIPWLYDFYEQIASFEMFERIPIVSILFSLSLPIWLLLFVLTYLLIQKKYNLIIPILPPIFVWCTYLLGPVSNFRYMFPLVVMYPILLALLQPSAFEEEVCEKRK
ncbi:MAG: hypothetical protein IJY10_04765 [Lachnospiraceae bacterium]|nr:hypothetical protein [Lachnospiraceae bacterium]